jgi:chaperonin GroES
MSANGLRPGGGGSQGPGSKAQTTKEEVETMNIRPLHDRVVVRRIEQKETVRGGIIIPDTAKEKPQEAEVVAVGPGKVNEDGKRAPMDVKKGDRVLIGKYSGSEIKIDEEELVIVREDEILAVLEKNKK